MPTALGGTLAPDTDFGTLTVNGQSCFTAWCAITDMSALLDDAELRGANVLVPHVVGTRARRRRRTTTRKDLPMVFTGAYDLSETYVGGGLADRKRQLLVNIEAFREALGIGEDAPAGSAGTVTALWDRSALGLSNKSAAVHVLSPLRVELHIGAVATATLSLEIPLGSFA